MALTSAWPRLWASLARSSRSSRTEITVVIEEPPPARLEASPAQVVGGSPSRLSRVEMMGTGELRKSRSGFTGASTLLILSRIGSMIPLRKLPMFSETSFRSTVSGAMSSVPMTSG